MDPNTEPQPMDGTDPLTWTGQSQRETHAAQTAITCMSSARSPTESGAARVAPQLLF